MPLIQLHALSFNFNLPTHFVVCLNILRLLNILEVLRGCVDRKAKYTFSSKKKLEHEKGLFVS